MKARKTTLLAALVGAGVFALPVAAHAVAATPFSVTGDDDDSSSVPATIDSRQFSGSRDATYYRFRVDYEDLAKTPTTQRFVLIGDPTAKQGSTSIKANIVELRTNRKSQVSVHFYNYLFNSGSGSFKITPATCQGLAVSPHYDANYVSYAMPRACYIGSDKSEGALVAAQDGLFNDESWDPAAAFRMGSSNQPDSSDSVQDEWIFKPTASTSKPHAPALKLPLQASQG